MRSSINETGVVMAAELFKALSSPSRVALLRLLSTPRSVNTLVEITGLTQPLVSQHLRVLRQARLVTVERAGREALYEVADRHISHVVEDAVAHVLESVDSMQRPGHRPAARRREKDPPAPPER